MPEEFSYTIEEVSQLLKVSKLTIYDLVKKGDIPVYRVGRQMRISAKELDNFINSHKENQAPAIHAPNAEPQRTQMTHTKKANQIVISGQDLVLDILGKRIEEESSFKTLRSYSGSLNGLIGLYNGECDIVSLHMFDGDTGEYNLPYIKKILVGYPYILLNLLSRKAGFYVKKGNPLKITAWTDLNRDEIKIVNREKGSGARILLDEQLRINCISPRSIEGYENEVSNHLNVATAISAGGADVGVGIEKAAKIVGVGFVPLITERYDLVILKTPENETIISIIKQILSSPSFQSTLLSLGDYDTSQTGTVMYETN